ncbi:MAG: DUF2971 domain-containing protein [Erysipelotrichaceae bacterium]|nr:DUF2971 domain-containing protein [Erysipelotrichaceae bacterium]
MDKEEYKRKAIRLIEERPQDDSLTVSDEQMELFDFIPRKLYKYCPVNEYYLQDINEDKLFISPIEYLDDQFEAKLSLRYDFSQYYENLKTFLKQFPDISHLINDDENPEKSAYDLSSLLFKTRKEYGICSLSETNDSQIMWQMYGNSYRGICIEYDIAGWNDNKTKANILPVSYVAEKDSDPLKLLKDVIIQRITKKKDEQIRHYVNAWVADLFTTKNEEWSLQKEWRILGKAGTLIDGPEISAIIIGNMIEDSDRKTISDICRSRNITLYEVTEDYKHLKIAFRSVDL